MKKNTFRLLNTGLALLTLALLPSISSVEARAVSGFQKNESHAKTRCQRCRRGPDGKMICQDVDPGQCGR